MKKVKCALLVIDMQQVAFDGKITPPIANGQELLKNAAKLIGVCRSIGMPIIYLQTCAVSGQPYAKDVHGWDIHPEITPSDTDEVVYKVQSNGFENTNLQEVLTSNGVGTVVTSGIWSEYCVSATSRAALALGYNVVVAADCHGTVAGTKERAQEIMANQNEELAQSGALIIGVRDIKAELAAAQK